MKVKKMILTGLVFCAVITGSLIGAVRAETVNVVYDHFDSGNKPYTGKSLSSGENLCKTDPSIDSTIGANGTSNSMKVIVTAGPLNTNRAEMNGRTAFTALQDGEIYEISYYAKTDRSSVNVYLNPSTGLYTTSTYMKLEGGSVPVSQPVVHAVGQTWTQYKFRVKGAGQTSLRIYSSYYAPRGEEYTIWYDEIKIDKITNDYSAFLPGNTGFEEGANNFAIYYGNYGEFVSAASIAHNGSKSVKIFAPRGTPNANTFGQPIKVKGGAPYKFSCWVYQESSNTRNVKLQINTSGAYNASANWADLTTPVVTARNTWKQVSGTYTPAADGVVIFGVNINISNTADVFYFDDVVIVPECDATIDLPGGGLRQPGDTVAGTLTYTAYDNQSLLAAIAYYNSQMQLQAIDLKNVTPSLTTGPEQQLIPLSITLPEQSLANGKIKVFLWNANTQQPILITPYQESF